MCVVSEHGGAYVCVGGCVWWVGIGCICMCVVGGYRDACVCDCVIGGCKCCV